MPLNSTIANQPDVSTLLRAAWDTSTKNAVASGYMAGLIDALLWGGRVNEQEYQAAYERYVYGQYEG